MKIFQNKKKTVWAQLIIFIIMQTFILLNFNPAWAFSDIYANQPETLDTTTLSPHLEINRIHDAFLKKSMLINNFQKTENPVSETKTLDPAKSKAGIFTLFRKETGNINLNFILSITCSILLTLTTYGLIGCASWGMSPSGIPTPRLARSLAEDWSIEETIQKLRSSTETYQRVAAEKIIKEGTIRHCTNEQLVEAFYWMSLGKWTPKRNALFSIVLKMIAAEIYARNDKNLNEKVLEKLVWPDIHNLDYADPSDAKDSETFQKIIIIGKIAMPALMENITRRVGTTDTQKWSAYLIGIIGDFETSYKFLDAICRSKDEYPGWVRAEASGGLRKLSKRYPKEFQEERERNKSKKNSADSKKRKKNKLKRDDADIMVFRYPRSSSKELISLKELNLIKLINFSI
ncbi:MAG: hypothetical protein KAQ79_21605 [Cyclobacteriaceae bacterium]|nr:hypothetical protein [Cyclobacteriaceae bacterium]